MMDALEFSLDRQVLPEDLLKLMLQTSWGKERTVAGLRRMLGICTITLGVWDGDKLVGFARAISDGTYRSLIEDIIVDADYRGRGIGAKIIRMLADRLSNVKHIYLFTGKHMEPYYNRFGFELTPCISMRLLPEGRRSGT